MRTKAIFLAILLIACSVLATPLVQAQEVTLYDDWDGNDDGMLDDNKFGEGVASVGYYNDWDTDGNDMLDNQEFGDGLFETWDANDDDIIDTKEWDYGLYEEFGADYKDFTTWDADGDGEITENEFDAVYDVSSIYDDWDLDGNSEITDHEVNDGIFSWFDDNDNNYLDDTEAALADDVFGDYL